MGETRHVVPGAVLVGVLLFFLPIMKTISFSFLTLCVIIPLTDAGWLTKRIN